MTDTIREAIATVRNRLEMIDVPISIENILTILDGRATDIPRELPPLEAAAFARTLRAYFVPSPTTYDAAIGMSGEKSLSITIEGGVLKIEIGIGALAFAANEGQYSHEEKEWKVSNPDKFAEDVLIAMKNESETGHTMVTALIDKAIEEAIEQGSEWIDEVINLAPQ